MATSTRTSSLTSDLLSGQEVDAIKRDAIALRFQHVHRPVHVDGEHVDESAVVGLDLPAEDEDFQPNRVRPHRHAGAVPDGVVRGSRPMPGPPAP